MKSNCASYGFDVTSNANYGDYLTFGTTDANAGAFELGSCVQGVQDANKGTIVQPYPVASLEVFSW